MENKFKKMTKENLYLYIEANFNSTYRTYLGKDHLSERLENAIKTYEDKPHRVTKKTLEALCEEVYAILGEKADYKAGVESDAEQVTLEIVEADNAENVVEPEKPENVVEETPAAPAEKKVGGVTKTKKKKESSLKKPNKKVENTPEPPKAKKNNLSAVLATSDTFPETLSDGVDTYVIAHEIKNVGDFKRMFDTNQYDFLLAAFWTKRHLKQFQYSQYLGQPESFPNNLDLLGLLYITDKNNMVYALSQYTEALYTFLPDDIEEVDGLRFSNGMEFQIYVRSTVQVNNTEDDSE